MVSYSNGFVFKWFRIQMASFDPPKHQNIKNQNHLMIGHVLTISIPIMMVFRSPLYYQFNFFQIWDLRLASSPLRTLEQHQRGILSLAWCKQVSTLVFMWPPLLTIRIGIVRYANDTVGTWIPNIGIPNIMNFSFPIVQKQDGCYFVWFSNDPDHRAIIIK